MTGGGGHGLSLMQDEWKSLLYTDHAVLNRDEAWGQVQSLQGFGSGGSKTNSLLWVSQKPCHAERKHPIDSSLYTLSLLNLIPHIFTSHHIDKPCDYTLRSFQVASRSPISVVDKPIIEVPVDDNIVVTPVIPRKGYNAVTMVALVAALVVVMTVVGVVAVARMRTQTSYSRVQETTSV